MNNRPRHPKRTLLHSFLVIAALAIICAAPSCTCNPNAPAPADYRIKTMKVDNDPVVEYTYDGQNRVKTIKMGPSLTTYDFLENPKRVEKRENGTLIATYLLNNEGYMNADGLQGFEDYIYSYNPAGNRVIQEPGPSSSVDITSEFTWDGKGNLTEVKISSNGNLLLRDTYEYSDKTDTRIDGMDWFSGKRPKNLVEKQTSQLGNRTLNYQFDARGRVIQEVSTSRSNTRVTTYTYFN